MGKVRINKSLCKQAPAQAARTWVEADDYETVEAEMVDFKNLEAETVGF